MELYVTGEESFERGYNKKKRTSAQKTDDSETVPLPNRHAPMPNEDGFCKILILDIIKEITKFSSQLVGHLKTRK